MFGNLLTSGNAKIDKVFKAFDKMSTELSEGIQQLPDQRANNEIEIRAIQGENVGIDTAITRAKHLQSQISAITGAGL